MPTKPSYEKVGKLFLSEVFKSFQTLRNRLRSLEINQDEEQIIKKFDNNFKTTAKPKQFYFNLYKTKLMKVEQIGNTSYVKIFGFLRTLFIGILKGDPRAGYLSKRTIKYEATNKLVSILEDFIHLYRKKVGFFPHPVSDDVLASANLFSSCEKKPYELCHSPKCTFIHSTAKRGGYCRTNITRKNKRNYNKSVKSFLSDESTD
jgi:hypothetical protein